MLSFVKGPSVVSAMGGKALIDLLMWHGPQEVEKAVSEEFLSELNETMSSDPVNSGTNGVVDVKLLGLLCIGLERFSMSKSPETDESESVQAVLGEGFAKILLLSEKYPAIPASSHPLLFEKLMHLYFCSEATALQR